MWGRMFGGTLISNEVMGNACLKPERTYETYQSFPFVMRALQLNNATLVLELVIGTTILTAVTNSVDPTTEVVFNENPDTEFMKANKFSYAIVAVGEIPYVETYGDSKTLTIDEPGYTTITNVCEAVKCVVVIISGRPVVIEPYLEKIDALVAAWLPGTEGQGITDVLFGGYGFTGKLARTWFRRVDQLPMNVGDPHYDPLFPFGYGLTTSPRVVKAPQ